jgi:Spy/CpxP family protein refolding chaperone
MRLAATITAAVLLMTALPLAQGRGGSRGGVPGGGGGGGGGTPSPFDQLIDELDLDTKTQVPAVTALLEEVEPEARTLFQELVARRQDLLNVETNRSSDPAPAAAYTATATQLIGLETKVFGEIFALLTPKQRQKAAKGFDRLEALFKDTLSVSGRAPGGGRGGPLRGMPPQGGGR